MDSHRTFNIKYAMSLGNTCHVAYLLKRLRWKPASYPFDWIRSNPEMVRHCIRDDFKQFLDVTQYINHDPANVKAGVGHAVYGERIFVHHNPFVFKSHYDYFSRCVERFKCLINKNNEGDGDKSRLLFIVGFFNNPEPVCHADIIELNQILCARGIRNHIVLVINHTTTPPAGPLSHRFEEHDDLHVLELRTSSESNGVEFNDNADNLYLDAIVRNKYLPANLKG